MAHELSHVWFNDDRFTARWLSEGYASWAERAVGANTTDCVPGPTRHRHAGPRPCGGPPMRATQEQLDIVDYQYEAACTVISDTAEKIGTDRMRDASGSCSADAGISRDAGRQAGAAAVDWRQWLDAVDERGALPAGVDDTAAMAEVLLRLRHRDGCPALRAAPTRTHLVALRRPSRTPGGLGRARGRLRGDAGLGFASRGPDDRADGVLADGGRIEGVLPPRPWRRARSRPGRGREHGRRAASDPDRGDRGARPCQGGHGLGRAAVARADAEPGLIEQVGLIGTGSGRDRRTRRSRRWPRTISRPRSRRWSPSSMRCSSRQRRTGRHGSAARPGRGRAPAAGGLPGVAPPSRWSSSRNSARRLLPRPLRPTRSDGGHGPDGRPGRRRAGRRRDRHRPVTLMTRSSRPRRRPETTPADLAGDQVSRSLRACRAAAAGRAPPARPPCGATPTRGRRRRSAPVRCTRARSP